jgi:hypothetical protein
MPTAGHDKALATVEDGLFIFLDDSKVNDFVVAEGTPGQWKWVVNRDGRWAGGTETVFADHGPDDVRGEVMLLADGELLCLPFCVLSSLQPLLLC